MLFLTSECRYIRLDTCIVLIGGGVANELAYNFADTTHILVCANEAAIITVDVIDTSPQPPLPPIFFDTDTACTTLAIDMPAFDVQPDKPIVDYITGQPAYVFQRGRVYLRPNGIKFTPIY